MSEIEKKEVLCTRNFWGQAVPKEVTKEELQDCQAICGECETAWDCFGVDGNPLPFELI